MEDNEKNTAPETPEQDVKSESPAAEQDDLQAQLEKLQADYDKMREVAAYAQADVINIRTRSEREIARARAYGSESTVLAMLPVFDNLERALSNAESDPASIAEGVKMVKTQFTDVLKTLGVIEFDPLGQPFTHVDQNAMSMVPVADKAQDGIVQMVVNKGFKLGDKVIRAAMVIVGKYTEPEKK